MTRQKRAAHNAKGKALDDTARRIVFDLDRCFGLNGEADLVRLDKMSKRAAEFSRAYQDWEIAGLGGSKR